LFFKCFFYALVFLIINIYFTGESKIFGAIGFGKSWRGFVVFDGNAVSTLRAGPGHVPICKSSVDGAPVVFSTASGVFSWSPEINPVDGFISWVIN